MTLAEGITILMSIVILYATHNLDKRVDKLNHQFNHKMQRLERARELAKEWQKTIVREMYAAGFEEAKRLTPTDYFSQLNVLEIDLQAIVKVIGDQELNTILDNCLAVERPTYTGDDPPMDEINAMSIKTGQAINARFIDFYKRLYVLMEEAAK